jgi:hypothetical protein
MFLDGRFGDLHTILGDQNANLADVLKFPYIVQAARFRFPRLCQFVSRHSLSLLTYALSTDSPDLSTTAFTILNSGTAEYIRPLLETNSYRDVSFHVLSQNDPPVHLVARIASLTLVALIHMPEIACDMCGFIYRLLPYCENATVFTLFDTLMNADTDAPHAQHWLKEIGVCEYIRREIVAMPFDYVSDLANTFQDPVYVKAICLFRLVARGLCNPILCDELRRDSVVLCLQKQFPQMPDFVQNARWSAIARIICEQNAPTLGIFLEEALRIVSEPFERLKMYRVSALGFITTMMKFSSDTYKRLEESCIPAMLVTVAISFPNSTILHNAFLHFIETGLTNLAFADRVIRLYVPAIVVKGESDENRIMKSLCIRLMELFIDAVSKQPQLRAAMAEAHEGATFIERTVIPFRKITKETYGGFPKSLRYFYTD